MTYEEAKEILKIFQTDEMMMLTSSDFDEAVKLAIKAMDKQVAKKVKIETYRERTSSAGYEAYVCPICGEYSALVKDVKVSEDYQQPYCWRCGQKLDWSEE